MEYTCIQYTRYHDSLVSEFFWKLENVVDVLRGRATREAKFKEAQASNVLNLVQNAGTIGAVVANAGGILLSFLGDVKESKKQNILSPEILSGQWEDLRKLVEASACLAVRRYSLFLKSIPEVDAVELGHISAQRIWTHLSDNRLPFSTDNLLDGILSGKSGRWEDDWRNTGISVEAESRRCTAEGALKHAGIAYTDSTGQWQFYIHPRDKGVVQFPKYKFMLLSEAEAQERIAKKKYVESSPTLEQRAVMVEHWAAPLQVPTTSPHASVARTHQALEIRLQKLQSDFLSFEEWKDTLHTSVLSLQVEVSGHSQTLTEVSTAVRQVIAVLPELNQTLEGHASQLSTLSNKVHKLAERSNFTYIPRPFYQPREAPYKALAQRVQDHSSGLIVVVGSGGVGKTSLVTQYMHAQRDSGQYHRILRMAMDSASIESSLVDLCQQLFITTKDRKREDWLPEIACRLLNQSWLIVWDNVDSASSIESLLPFFVTKPARDTNCPQDLIVTTRNAFGWVEPVLVDVFNQKEALSYIKHHLTAAGSPFFREDEAMALAEILGYHPLALELALGDLCVYQQPIKALLSSLKYAGLLSLAVPQHRVTHVGRLNENSLQTLWQLSLQRLSKDAIQLLRVLSFCSADGASGAFLSLFLPSVDSNRYKDALFALQQHSLLKLVSIASELNPSETVNVERWVMHRLLQDAVRFEALREWETTDRLKTFLEDYVFHLKAAFFDTTVAEPSKQKRMRVREGKRHGAHFYACTLLITANQTSTYLFIQKLRARLLTLVGDQEKMCIQHYQGGKNHFQEAIALYESLPGVEAVVLLAHAIHNFAACCLAMEQYTVGQVALNRSIRLSMQIANAAEDSAERQIARVLLVKAHQLKADFYLRMCEYDLSAVSLNTVDSLMEQFFPSSSDLTAFPASDPVFLASSLTIKCKICLVKKDFTQALALNSEAVSLLRAAPENSEFTEAIAVQYATAALMYAQCGKFSKAHQHYTLAISQYKKEYGENGNHPSIALLLNSIGKLYIPRKDPHAKQYCLQALAMFEALGIVASEELANTLGNLSQYAYSVEGNFAAANEYGIRALAILQTVNRFTGKSKLTANICATLASITRSSGDIASAREYAQAALEASLDIHGANAVHEDIAMSYSSLGMVELVDGNYDKAQRRFETAMQMCLDYWGEDTPHQQFADLHINLATTTRHQHRNADAHKHYLAALHILRAIGMQEDHPDVKGCVASLMALDSDYSREDAAESNPCCRAMLGLVCCPCALLYLVLCCPCFTAILCCGRRKADEDTVETEAPVRSILHDRDQGMQSIEEQISTVFASYPAAERAGESMSHINSTPRKLSNNDAETRRKLQVIYEEFAAQKKMSAAERLARDGYIRPAARVDVSALNAKRSQMQTPPRSPTDNGGNEDDGGGSKDLQEPCCPRCDRMTLIAAEKGHLTCLGIAIYHYPIHADACTAAAAGNHVDCLALLRENNADWTSATTRAAADNDSEDTLRYLLEYNCPDSNDLLICAAAGGSRNCLRYLVEERGKELTIDVFGAAFERAHLECVKYLIDTGCPVHGYSFREENEWYLCRRYHSGPDADELFLNCILWTVHHGWSSFIECPNLVDYILDNSNVLRLCTAHVTNL